MSALTIGEAIELLSNLPDICGLESVLLDNIANKPANYLDSRVQGQNGIMLVYHDPIGENAMQVHSVITMLREITPKFNLTIANQIFVDDIISLPKPQPLNIKLVDGVVYLRYVEP